MSDTTAISWADSTWSPWEGCTKVGPGCDNCYAEAMNNWLRAGENWGPGAPRRIYSEDHWDKPAKWQRAALKFETMYGRRRRVFPSVCDPFDNEAPPTLRTRLWGLIRLTPSTDWLLLTKRIGNAKSMLPPDWGDGYQNVWIGATVVNQPEYDRDIGKLLRIPAVVHFLSVEPMLGAIDMRLGGKSVPDYSEHRPMAPLSWVVAGGESGRRARPAHPDWFRSLRDQCAAAGVPFHFKQWGEWRARESVEDTRNDPARSLRYMRSHDMTYRRLGKKAAGRLLDGVQHDAFPGDR